MINVVSLHAPYGHGWGLVWFSEQELKAKIVVCLGTEDLLTWLFVLWSVKCSGGRLATGFFWDYDRIGESLFLLSCIHWFTLRVTLALQLNYWWSLRDFSFYICPYNVSDPANHSCNFVNCILIGHVSEVIGNWQDKLFKLLKSYAKGQELC